MLLTSFYAILGTFYTLLNNTDLDLSYFDLSYVFPGHNDSVKRGLTVLQSSSVRTCLQLSLRQWGASNVVSVVQLISKHCRKPRRRNGVVDKFGLSVQGVCTSSICTKVNVQIGASQHISHPC